MRKLIEYYRTGSLLRREGLLLAGALLVGVTLVPAAVYAVGNAALGRYAHGGVWSFAGDYFAGLFRLQEANWLAVLGPWVMLLIARGLVVAFRRLPRQASLNE
ncbi:MAG: hypothetical protein R3E77_08195 [Steroidobacteraceae bacterium]